MRQYRAAMKAKKRFLIVICFFLISIANLNAQNEQENSTTIRPREDIFIAPTFDIAMYVQEGAAYGGGIMIGYGNGAALGLKISYYVVPQTINILEFSLLARFYLFGAAAYSGPFLQFIGGAVLVNREGELNIPSFTGSISAGLCFGWRFLFADRWYIEPAVRGGYPYIIGGSLSTGVRF